MLYQCNGTYLIKYKLVINSYTTIKLDHMKNNYCYFNKLSNII